MYTYESFKLFSVEHLYEDLDSPLRVTSYRLEYRLRESHDGLDKLHKKFLVVQPEAFNKKLRHKRSFRVRLTLSPQA